MKRTALLTLLLTVILLSAGGCIQPVVDAGCNRVEKGLTVEKSNLDKVFERQETLIAEQDVALPGMLFMALKSELAKGKLTDKTIDEAEARMRKYMATRDSQIKEIQVARQDAADNRKEMLEALAIIRRAGRAIGTRDEVNARLDRLESMLVTVLTPTSKPSGSK